MKQRLLAFLEMARASRQIYDAIFGVLLKEKLKEVDR